MKDDLKLGNVFLNIDKKYNHNYGMIEIIVAESNKTKGFFILLEIRKYGSIEMFSSNSTPLDIWNNDDSNEFGEWIIL